MAVVPLGACSSSDDVVAVLGGPAALPPPGTVGLASPAAGVGVVSGGTVEGSGAATTSAAASAIGDAAPNTAAGVPAAVMPSSDAEGLFIRGTPASPPVVNADAWPLETLLRDYFPPPLADEPPPHLVSEPDVGPLRELGAAHGLGVTLVSVTLRVEDQTRDQYQIELWEN